MVGYDFLAIITHIENLTMAEKFDLPVILKCNAIHINPKFKNKLYIFVDIKLSIKFLFCAFLVCKSINLIFMSNICIALNDDAGSSTMSVVLLNSPASMTVSLERPGNPGF